MSNDQNSAGTAADGAADADDLRLRQRIVAAWTALSPRAQRNIIACGIIIVVFATAALLSGAFFGDHKRRAREIIAAGGVMVLVLMLGTSGFRSIRQVVQKEQRSEKDTRRRQGLATQLLRESQAMVEYALSKGLVIAPHALISVAKAEEIVVRQSTEEHEVACPPPEVVAELAEAHRVLVEVVSPATPSTLDLLRSGEQSWFFKPLGRVRLIRHMLYIAVVFLVGALLIVVLADALSVQASRTIDPGIGEVESVGEAVIGETRVDRFWNSAFLIAVAGLGAAFYALYTATRYVKSNSYDEQYEPTYWIRFVLGLVGGFALALIIGNEYLDDSTIGIPLLAFAGGFSADIVHRVLQRIVDTIDALVRGSGEDRVEERLQAAQATAAVEVAEQRVRLAAPLMALEGKLGAVEDEEVRRELRAVITQMLPHSAAERPNG